MAHENETISIYMDGHEGHRGHVLAHAWLDKLRAFVGVLSSMERDYLGAKSRQTEYEIVEAKKVNPTIIQIRPVPKKRNYDPRPAFVWSAQQFESVARFGEADQKLSAATVEAMSGLANEPTADAYKSFWINGQSAPVYFDDQFRAKAAALAAARITRERPFDWFEGTTYGSVVGELRFVDDIEGDHRIAIKPVAGPEKIECFYEPSLEATLRENLFHRVRVQGYLNYKRTSPHPASVKVTGLDKVESSGEGLGSLKGLLRGEDRPDGNGLEQLIRGR